MTISAGTVFINVAANIGPFRTQMLGLGSTVSKVGSNISRVGTGISRALTVPLGFAAIAATKLAVDYDAAFTRISAVSNASAKDIAKWKDQVLQLAGKTARAPEELADALYFLASAGLNANQVFPALRESAKAAAVGLGETGDIAKLVANVLNAYSKAGLTAADVTDTLVAAVKAGTAEPNEFADALGRILPIASKAKVEFDNVAASLAVVSNIGLDVNEGVTAMRGLLNALISPGTQAEETLHKIGLTTIELRDIISEKGLLGTIRILERETKAKFGEGWLDQIDKIIPNIRALTGALGLTVQETQKVNQIFKDVQDSTGSADIAFQKTTKSSLFQFNQALAKLKATGITIGRQLIPILLDVADAIANWVSSFRDLDPETQHRIIEIGLALIALGPVIRIIGGLTTAFGGLLAVFRGIAGIGTSAVRAITGVTAAAAEAEQLTLFGGGAAAAGGGFGGAIAVGIGALVAALVGLKIAIDNANEEVDGMVESFQAGKRTTEDVARENEHLTRTFNETADASQNVGLSAKFAAPAMNAMRTQIDQNNEAAKRYNTNLRKMIASHGVSIGTADQLADMFSRLGNTTEAQRHIIARIIGSFEAFGKHVKQSTLNLVEDYISLGQTGKAIRLLTGEYNRVVGPIEKAGKAVAQHAQDSEHADRAQKQLAAGAKNVKTALEQSATGAVKGKNAIHDLGVEADKVGKKNVKPKVSVDASAAQTTLQGLRTQLETLTNKKWTANVNVTTTGGSTGFHLLQMLEDRLEEITSKPWKANVEVTAEDSTIRAITGFANEATRGLEKVKRIVEQVFGEDFPKAYQDDLKAFKEASSEKLKTFATDLKSYTKIFDKLKEKVNNFKDSIRSAFADASTLIAGALEELAKTTTVTGPEGDSIEVATPGDIGTYLQNQIAEAKDFATKLAKLAASGLAPALLSELAGQGTAALPLVDALLTGGKDLIQQFNEANMTIKKFADVTANALGEEYFGGAVKKARNQLEGLADKIDRFSERIGNSIQGFVDALQARKVGDEIESLIQSLNRSLRQLGVSVPHAATGGIVRKKTLLYAGEAGPEAIVPLSKNGTSGIGGDIIINLDVRGNAIYAKDLAEEVRSILLKDKRFKGVMGLA